MKITRAVVPFTAIATTTALAIVSRPLASMPSDVALLYVSECPASQYTFKLLKASPTEAQAKMWPIPTEVEVAGPACAYTLPRLRSRHWLFMLAPDRFLCGRLVDEAFRFAERKISSFPSYVIGDEVLPGGLEGPAFAHIGLSVGMNRSGRFAELLTDVPRKVARTPAKAMSEFYQSVGY